ncbi:MAG: hypothetical protein ACRENQ_08290 [Gemmatimonadaceae bacterium]
MFWPIFISAVTFWGTALAAGAYWARRYVRAIEATANHDAELGDLRARVAVLEAGSPALLGSNESASERIASPRQLSNRGDA